MTFATGGIPHAGSRQSSNHLILCCPLLLPTSVFPSIRVFSYELALQIRWPEYGSFSFNDSPSNEYSELSSFRTDWFDLLAVQGTLKSLLQRFEGISFSVLSLHYGPTLTYMTTGKTITLTFVGKAMSLLFNMLSSFVIAFLPMKEGVGSQREELCPWQRS